MIINLQEALDLVEFFGGGEGEVHLQRAEAGGEGHAGPGLYASMVGYPGEGSVLLGPPLDHPPASR